MGRKGDAGSIGPRGSQGKKGEKGNQGPRGLKGASIEAPRITVRPMDQTVTSTGFASFTCEATGNPKPKVSLEPKEKKMDSRYKTNGNGTLTITDVMLKDRGAIECIAKSVIGEDSSTAHLSVVSGT